ncbi:MAG: single-stranded DNA-binding protein [Puia sp.]|nr:single-stranded DNA-binding protein [Puia sp.]
METVVGYLTKDAKVSWVGNYKVVNFTVAKNRTFKGRDGKVQKKTKFYECSYWNVENVAPYLLKGTLVEVEGDVDAKAYQKNDGEPGASLTLRVTFLQMYQSKKTEAEDLITETVPLTNEPIDDLPF